MRLQKYLANAGIGSRRKCEEYILQGRVKINHHVIETLGTLVQEGDLVCFDDKHVEIEEEKVYYLLHKPVGYITSVQDEKGRPTVMDLIEDGRHRVFPVGRLDYNTSGLLLLTNDGDLTYGLTHPKHEVSKTYVAVVKGDVPESALKRLREGIRIEHYKTSPAKVEKIKQMKDKTTLSLTIHEGKNRQVRKMCEAIGHSVLSLKRVAIGEIELNDLEEGKWRKLSTKEVIYLKRISVLDKDTLEPLI